MTQLPNLEDANGVVLVVDVDGTICSNTNGSYTEAVPFYSAISKINDYFEAGARIIYFTARGSTTGIDWRDETLRQFSNWGVRHHELVMGKPFGDFYIDDKAVPSEAIQ